MNKILILVAVLIVSAVATVSQVQAARIYGNIYDTNIELLENVVVSVNSTPKQTLIAADGAYSFELAPGNYMIEAIYSGKEIIYTKENIIIAAEGSYVLDLILFETLEIEELEFDESDVALIDNFFNEAQKGPGARDIALTILFIALIIAGSITYLIFRHKKLKKGKTRLKKRKVKEKIPSPDETLNKVINFIRKEKRTTQKEVRKQLGMSEAKVSLLVTDLEDRKIVRKIKKGRGNIIIYNK